MAYVTKADAAHAGIDAAVQADARADLRAVAKRAALAASQAADVAGRYADWMSVSAAHGLQARTAASRAHDAAVAARSSSTYDEAEEWALEAEWLLTDCRAASERHDAMIRRDVERTRRAADAAMRSGG